MVSEILSSDPKSTSAMRLMSFISLFSGIALGFYGLYKGDDPEKLSWLCMAFVASAFGGKVWQKKYEVAAEVAEADAAKSDGK